MMPIRFTVSAPGKVILNGEHSVVYNKPALAGVIGLRNYITFTEISESFIKIKLDAFGGIEVALDLSTVNQFLTDIGNKFDMENFLDISEETHDEYLDVVTNFVRTNMPNVDGTLEKAFCAFIYLLIGIGWDGKSSRRFESGMTLNFKSEISIGAGLGSSASYAACLAATFYTYSLTRTTTPTFATDFNQSLSADEKVFFLNVVSSWAFMSERIMHGNPSGLDNTICIFGNVVQYMKKPQIITNVAMKMKLHILLVDSGVSRNTLQVVEGVKMLREQHEQLIDIILNAMGVLVHDVVRILENDQPDAATQSYEQLKRLFKINNNLLRALDVSHSKLEEIFSISERHDFACKLTGAGAGGYAIILLPPNYTEQPNYQCLCNELTINGFKWNVTTIGGEGLQISEAH